MKAIILTRQHCPNCDKLKMFMYANFKGAHDDSIEWVIEEDEKEKYDKLLSELPGEYSTLPIVVFMEGTNIVDSIMIAHAPAKIIAPFKKYL